MIPNSIANRLQNPIAFPNQGFQPPVAQPGGGGGIPPLQGAPVSPMPGNPIARPVAPVMPIQGQPMPGGPAGGPMPVSGAPVYQNWSPQSGSMPQAGGAPVTNNFPQPGAMQQPQNYNALAQRMQAMRQPGMTF